MDRKRLYIVAAIAALLVTAALPTMAAAAGKGDKGVVGPIVGVSAHHDTSPPLRDMQPVPPKLGSGIRMEIVHPAPPAHGRVNAPDHPVHPRLQTENRPDLLAAATPSLSFDFEGVSDDDNAAVAGVRIVPPDTNGDVSPGHYVQYINLAYQVWSITRDGSGTPTGATSVLGPIVGNAFWAGFGDGVPGSPSESCENNNDGDPIALFDHLASQWVVSQFSINQGVQCFAISVTSDPTGSYHRYAFEVSPGQQNDYPKLGMMPGAYYLSLRDFPSGSSNFAGFVALERAAMLTGSAATFVKFGVPCAGGDCPDGVQPPHLEGPAPAAGTPGYFTRAWDDDFDGPLTGTDGVRIWELDPDFATPASSTFSELAIVPVADYDSTVCGFFQRTCIDVPKRGGGSDLDPIDELQMYRAQYRSFAGHDSLLINTTVDSDGNDTAGILWVELRNSGSGWTLHQDGIYAPGDGESRWMGSAAMNGQGDIALGYSLSSRDTFPSIRYVTRQSGDAAGTMPGGEVELFAGTGAQTQANRWGDYSSMSVDPVDDCTFWYTNQYYETTSSFDFKTRVGVFAGPSCGPPCVPDETPEVSCNDGNDNDCDGDFDCDDADCAPDPICICTLGGVGDPCTNGEDCCSGNCSGGKPSTRECLP